MDQAEEQRVEEPQNVDRLVWPQAMDPVSQARLWVPNTPYPWQQAVLRDLMAYGARVACVTPNESGKTSLLIPVAGLSFMAAFPGAQVVSTSGVERQIKEQLWPVLRGCLAPYPNWSITEELEIKAPRIRKLQPSTWKAFTARDPQAAEGFHARTDRDSAGRKVWCPLMVIIDEAKSFEDEKLMFAFQRCDPDIWLMVSTPGEDSGPFYEAFHSRKGAPWKTHEVTWHDCPHLLTGRKFAERQNLIETRGKEDPQVMSMVFGKFYRRGAKYVFDHMEIVDRAMSGMIRVERGQRRAAIDFSGGGDEQVFMARDGNMQIATHAYKLSDTDALAQEFVLLFKKYELRPEDITADNGGLGQAVIDNLEAKGWSGIRRYQANAAPRDKSLFVNIAAEDHWYVKRLLELGSISLMPDEVLKRQMRRRRYQMRKDESNRIRLEPKEDARIKDKESPDRLDTAVMLFGDMPPPRVRNVMEEPGGRICGRMGDCFAAQGQESSFGWE